MIAQTLLALLILFIPVASYAAYCFAGKSSLIVGGGLNVAVAGLMYFGPDLSGIFYIDFTTWVFVIMVASVHFLSVTYATKYFHGTDLGIRENTFYLLMSLFTTSMFFSLEINNFGLMWVGIEATTISSSLLL
ncbi:MAG TPA: hydrogenase 4 subunit F, partial [Thermoplasmataceae archaeon]|nr:hydrogenase 4 subunit F [Thermoplasmataceae archaeon]